MTETTIRLPFGPYHLALEEPFRVNLEVEGERVKSAKVRIGYAHRGIEYILQRRRWYEGLRIVERVCSICTQAHSQCYAQGVEELAGVEVPERAKWIRMVVAELNRIESHLLLLGVLAHKAGFDTLFMYTWYAREKVMDALEILTGNRVQYAINVLGGVRRDIDGDVKAVIRDKLSEAVRALNRYEKTFLHDRSLRSRLSEVGVLTKEEARRLCVVGPVLRGSGVEWDIRRKDPYLAYSEVEFDVVVRDEGDAYARAAVRLGEVHESAKIITQALERMPEGPISAPLERVPQGSVTSRVEAPRGELLYHIVSGGGETPERVKIRTPTLPNVRALEYILVGYQVADVPVIIGSIDPCISCEDR
jgi:NADH-quinone oxidoreductase subunit D